MSEKKRVVSVPAISSEELLKNGLEAVQTGARLLKSDASSRDLRLALREVNSGVELVLKAILVSEHWTLIFDDPKKADIQNFLQGKFKSAGFEDCLGRLDQIVGIKLTSKQSQHLAGMRDKRNRLEHLGVLDNLLALRAALGGSLHALVTLVELAEQKGLMPSGSEQLHTEIAIDLASVDDFVKQRWKEISPSLPKGGGDPCFACGKDAAVIDDGLQCKFCGTRMSPEDAADEYVSSVLGICRYETVKDGGEWPIDECPECNATALVPTTNNGYRCFGCDSRYNPGDLVRCLHCGTPFRSDADGFAMCDECFSSKMQQGD
ncbi:hypothetical protein [Polyangium aurulentum]|uniref:hypothetical protein n=1 Tax=Polyangium aurulentum TaxID=2567896 RepID=UPI0010AEC7CD|nr:hypothetical protein [Polyangium aurulentum]UQA54984.1 hypothetical protein E8A73_026900 [Polyangium aurulentum]